MRGVRVFRLHIRPGGGLQDPAASFAYCLREGVLGVGWQVPIAQGKTLTWQDYQNLAIEEHGSVSEISRVQFLHDQIEVGDLIWTRDTKGKYYLARVQSPWEYFDTPDGRNADIANVVRCRLLEVPQADEVPGKIVACFRARRTIQSIMDATAVFYSQLLWNQLAGRTDYTLPTGHRHNLFAYLDAEATEDVIFIYLQVQGWIVIPNSRKADTMAYEFVAVNRTTFERALVSVKTGNTPLPQDVWTPFREKIFLFQASGIYTGRPTANVVTLSPKDIETFMRSNLAIMPRAVQRWIQFVPSRDL
jgi:hypothetical protein